MNLVILLSLATWLAGLAVHQPSSNEFGCLQLVGLTGRCGCGAPHDDQFQLEADRKRK